MDRLGAELKKIKSENIIEGPLNLEEPETFLKQPGDYGQKDSDRIRVTLDCQAVNKIIYPTDESIPSSELRYQIKGAIEFQR